MRIESNGFNIIKNGKVMKRKIASKDIKKIKSQRVIEYNDYH